MTSVESAQPGDVVVVHGHTTGDGGRIGVIEEVLGAPGHVHFRVRWDEEHESLFWPGSDAIVRPGSRRRRAARPSRPANARTDRKGGPS
jgi:hypothetical protein